MHTTTTTTTNTSQLLGSSMDTTSNDHNSDPHLSSNSVEKKRKSRRGCRAGVGRKKPRLVTTTAPLLSSSTAIHHDQEPIVTAQSSTNVHTNVPPYISAAAEAAAAVDGSANQKLAHTNTITDTTTNTSIVMTTVSERLLTRHVKSVKRSVRIDSASQVYNTQDLPSSWPSQNPHLSQERGQNYDQDDEIKEKNDENKMVVNESQVSNVSMHNDENNGCRSATRSDAFDRASANAVGDKPSSQHASMDIPQVL